MLREQRFLQQTHIRSAAATRADSAGQIVGYAAKYGKLSEDLGGFREKIAYGAFDKSLASGADVRFLRDHNPSIIFGRTKAGTLKLSTDSTGLRFACDMPNTAQARDVMASITRGDISQCSFAFRVNDNGEEWNEDGVDDDGERATIRTLRSVSLLDVSCVTYPAYEDTEVNVDPALVMGRSYFPEGVPVEIRSRIPNVRTVRATTSVEKRRKLFNFVAGL